LFEPFEIHSKINNLLESPISPKSGPASTALHPNNGNPSPKRLDQEGIVFEIVGRTDAQARIASGSGGPR
jgi:hypothetical protein